MSKIEHLHKELVSREEAIARASEQINSLRYIVSKPEELEAMRRGYMLGLAMAYDEAPQQIELEIERFGE